MTENKANAIFNILVAECGAYEGDRLDFVAHMLSGYREYRCCGALGFGGMFYPGSMKVSYYHQDRTAARELILESANQKLAKLLANKVER